jgi:glycosyltransferase involved in cell wall biosynthesis
MFCSVVIPTIGRETLSRAVCSVLEQSFAADDFEVIVVNDSGQPLSEAEWQKRERVHLLHTNRRERSFARNAGAAMAKGKYLCFLDDDDWLLSNAFEHFWLLARQENDAAWLYGGIRVVDDGANCLAELNSGLNGDCFAQILGGAWAPIQASMIRTEAFFAVGGYNPAICGTEDLDLCSRIARLGTFANTPATVACLFRGRFWGTSTNYLRAPDDTLLSRDQLLEESGAFTRIRASVRLGANPSYWHGRVLRVYLSTVLWNLRHKRLFRAASRASYCIAVFVLAGRHVLSRDYWEAARADHVPGTLHFVMKTLEEQHNDRLDG